jgi:hypothetical protein
MKTFPVTSTDDKKLFQKVKSLLGKKRVVDPVEDIHRSIAIVDLILVDSKDLGIQTKVVTWALKYMKQDPTQDISDAIIAAYEKWGK